MLLAAARLDIGRTAGGRCSMVQVYAGKSVIGVVGGIGSGKSFVARLFGELGCCVCDSDQQVREAYDLPEVIETLRGWWGKEIIGKGGRVDRTEIARRVFANQPELRRLEGLIHPLVGQIRDRKMAQHSGDLGLKAFVWDTPLLFEVGLDKSCDAVVFVDAPLAQRLERVAKTRGWAGEELIRREKSQMPLDKKREMAQYIVDNTADAAFARRQVEAVLSRILSQKPDADRE